MKKTTNLVAIIGFALGLAACDNGDNMNATINMQFSGNTAEAGVPAGRIEANTLQFNSGTITLTRIEFEAETDEADSVEVEIEQTVDIDFATGATTPDLSELVFPIGTYAEVRVELELRDEDATPSVVIEGTYTNASDEMIPIRFEFNSGETFEVEKEGTIMMEAGAQVLTEVTFDPVAWFAAVTREELSAARVNGDGVIVISETSNPDIFDIVADGLDLATDVEITL